MTAAPLILNCGVLILLIKEKALRTPFNVYVIVLLCSNILYVGINNITMIMTPVGHWWIGDGACTVQLYCRYIVITVITHSHVLISINRAWALYWPVSYKNNHTSTVAWLLCFGMVVYVHVCQLPGLVMDALYYRMPVQTPHVENVMHISVEVTGKMADNEGHDQNGRCAQINAGSVLVE
ncbi:uncharacterized protein LOC129599178 [Paramacrobiotus metropolitanus]|uniref:uncharacterized protein LOC129599178 n=1 Tax=Paramacrobiotus metropolitanus TaxID=2943436 RepID=UPI0024457B54|nr:uncharacterized protein LOC129599178 [Paramacrobiotus metropolitanus]